MRMLSALAITAFMANFANAKDFKLTGDNTKIEWTGTKKDGKHTGGFKTLTGTATSGDKMAFQVDIDVDSLHSDDTKLTGHLKSKDFFHVTEHPKAKFESKKVEKTDKGYTVTGDFTLLGKKKEISFPAKITASDSALKLEAEFKINRADYGMTYGEGKVNNDVAIKLTIDAK